MAVRILSITAMLLWMLAGWPHQIIFLNDFNVRYSGKILSRRVGRSQKMEKAVTRNHKAAGILRKQKPRHKEMSLMVDATISCSKHIWDHFALLDPVPLVFLQSSVHTMLFSVTGPMHIFFPLWNYFPSPICLLHVYSSLSSPDFLFSQPTSPAR